MARTIGFIVLLLATVSTAGSGQIPLEVARARDLVLEGLGAPDRHDAKEALERAAQAAREAVAAHPECAEAHYMLAVAQGSRLELLGLRAKVRLAGEVKSEAERALALDPDHAGAHHVLGRLHAGTMRLHPLALRVARAVLGSAALEGASWETAERHFLAAMAVEPGNPSHALELGALYLDTGRPEMARHVLGDLVEGRAWATASDATVARVQTLLARTTATGI